MKKLLYTICLLLSVQGFAKNIEKELSVNVLITSENDTVLRKSNSKSIVDCKRGIEKFKRIKQSELLITFKKENTRFKTIWNNTETGTIKSAFTNFDIELVINGKNKGSDYEI